jgi:hypothetical protein
MDMDIRFKAGDAVQVQVGGRFGNWCGARIDRPAPYRGREGYYISWGAAKDAPSWESRGGWVQGSCVRAADTVCSSCGSAALGAFVCSDCGHSTMDAVSR